MLLLLIWQNLQAVPAPVLTPVKLGGDDVPDERYEIYEKPRKPEHRDQALDKIIRESFAKISGKLIPADRIVQMAAIAFEHDDDEDAILLLLMS